MGFLISSIDLLPQIKMFKAANVVRSLPPNNDCGSLSLDLEYELKPNQNLAYHS